MTSHSKFYLAGWFAISIVITRIWIWLLERSGIFFAVEPHIGSFRIHHITLGIILLAVAGYVALAGHLTKRGRKLDLALYGVSLGLVADEILLALKTQSGELQAYPGEYFSFINTIPAIIVLVIFIFLIFAGKKKDNK